MNTKTTAELVTDAPQELQLVVQQNQLQPETSKTLFASYLPLFQQARGVIENSRQVVVTDANQTLQIKLAKAYRLELKAIRVAGENARKEIKAETVRRARAIDSFQHILEDVIVTEETRLEEQEKFAEVQSAKRKAALREVREKVLVELGIDANLYALGEMSEETFQQLVEGTKLARAADAERKRKEEAERIDRETKEAAERERIRQENERLKKEADEKEAAVKAEREAARIKWEQAVAKANAEREEHDRKVMALEEASRKKAEADRLAREELDRKIEAQRKAAAKKAAEEKAAREKLEAELRAKNEAEARRIAEAAEAARKAAAAPDKDRLITYANAVRALEIPTLSTPEANSIANTARASRDKFCDWICEKTGAL